MTPKVWQHGAQRQWPRSSVVRRGEKSSTRLGGGRARCVIALLGESVNQVFPYPPQCARTGCVRFRSGERDGSEVEKGLGANLTR